MKQISPTENNRAQKPTTEQIAVAAFHLYVENGCQDGHDLDDWLRAERLLTQKLRAITKVQVSEPHRETASRMVKIHPAQPREHLTHNERNNREGIRQRTTPSRPASRQLQWRTERPVQIKYAV